MAPWSRRPASHAMARAAVVLAILALGGAPGAGAQEPTAELSDVVMVPREGAVEVWVRLSRPVTATTAVFDRPWRLVLDFDDTRYRWVGGPLTVAQEPLRAIRGSQFRKGVARLVVELTSKPEYAIDQDREGLRIIFPVR